jgi:hypothetical protein
MLNFISINKCMTTCLILTHSKLEQRESLLETANRVRRVRLDGLVKQLIIAGCATAFILKVHVLSF